MLAADHDGGAAGERFADRGKSLASEHDRFAHGQFAKMRHVRFQPPRSEERRVFLCWRLITMVVRPGSGLPIEAKVLRPSTTGLPMVNSRKCAMSDFSRQDRKSVVSSYVGG